MNTALLRQVADHIRAHPEEFDMDGWDCGTTACIAGHALRINGVPSKLNFSYPSNAALILDLEEEDANDLFYQMCWPIDFSNRLDAADTLQEYANIAADRIEAFIEEYKE